MMQGWCKDGAMIILLVGDEYTTVLPTNLFVTVAERKEKVKVKECHQHEQKKES